MMFVWLAALNFLSVWFAVYTVEYRSRRRKRKVALELLETMGEQRMTDENFKEIMKKNFNWSDDE